MGRGYRTFLYERVAALQPQTVVMMNSGIADGSSYNVDYAWPSDLIALERNVPPGSGHKKWRQIEGKSYYMPGEVCDPIGKDWFWVKGDRPRSDQCLAAQFESLPLGRRELAPGCPAGRAWRDSRRIRGRTDAAAQECEDLTILKDVINQERAKQTPHSLLGHGIVVMYFAVKPHRHKLRAPTQNHVEGVASAISAYYPGISWLAHEGH